MVKTRALYQVACRAFITISNCLIKNTLFEVKSTRFCGSILIQQASSSFNTKLPSERIMPNNKQKDLNLKKKSKNSTEIVPVVASASPVGTNKDGTVTIQILAKPGAKHSTVTDISNEGVSVQIAAPPVDGEANTELIRYIASILDVRKSDVSLDKGSRSRNKTIHVSGSILKEDVIAKLQSVIKDN